MLIEHKAGGLVDPYDHQGKDFPASRGLTINNQDPYFVKDVYGNVCTVVGAVSFTEEGKIVNICKATGTTPETAFKGALKTGEVASVSDDLKIVDQGTIVLFT